MQLDLHLFWFEVMMESHMSHNTNSSLDTLLILDCEQEAKSKKYKNKRECKHRKDQKKKTGCGQTKVTQEIHVERKDFQCIINLNTTVCDHKNSHHSSYIECPKDRKTEIIERTTPHCLRQLCHQTRHEAKFHRHSKEYCKASLHHRPTRLKKDENKARNHKHRQSGHEKANPHKQSTHLRMNQNKAGNHKHRQSWHEKRLSEENHKELELVSPKMQFQYDAISTTSLESYLDIPTSYKYVLKNCRRKHESKLDTLIKRTKERERKLVEESRKTPWYANTPAHTEVSSMEFPMDSSELNMSIHSGSTFILEPKAHGYSPPIEGLCPNPTFERYLKYSSKSPIEYLFPNYGNNLEIKAESKMDIEAYSPTQSPDLKKFEIKKEMDEFKEKSSIHREIKLEI